MPLRRRRAGVLALELSRYPRQVWRQHSTEAAQARMSHVHEDPALADIVTEAWDLARSAPSRELVRSNSGEAGVVVVAHGERWSLVARSGGPVFVLSSAFDGVIRLEPDPFWLQAAELSALTQELINVSRGLPPFDESTIPAMPALPWHRDRQR